MTRDLDRVPVSEASPLELLRMVWRLWRGRRENPLVVAGSLGRPGRRVEGVCVLLAAALAWGVLLLAAVLLRHPDQVPALAQTWYMLARTTQGAVAVALPLLAVAVLGPVFVWRLGPRRRHVEALEELRLTALTNREVAFGFAYAPLSALLIVLLPLALAYLALWWGARESFAAAIAAAAKASPLTLAASPPVALPMLAIALAAVAQHCWRRGSPPELAGLRYSSGATTPVMSAMLALSFVATLAGSLSEHAEGPAMLWRQIVVWTPSDSIVRYTEDTRPLLWHGQATPAGPWLLLGLLLVVTTVIAFCAVRRLCACAGLWCFSRLDPEAVTEASWLASTVLKGSPLRSLPVRPRVAQGALAGVALAAAAATLSLELRRATRHEFRSDGADTYHAPGHFVAGDRLHVRAWYEEWQTAHGSTAITSMTLTLHEGSSDGARIPLQPTGEPGVREATVTVPRADGGLAISVVAIGTSRGKDENMDSRYRVAGLLSARQDGAAPYLGTWGEAWRARFSSPLSLAALLFAGLLVALRGFGRDRPLRRGDVLALALQLVLVMVSVTFLEWVAAMAPNYRPDSSLAQWILRSATGIGVVSAPLSLVLACLFPALVALAVVRHRRALVAVILASVLACLALAQLALAKLAETSAKPIVADPEVLYHLAAIVTALVVCGLLDGAFQGLHDRTAPEREGEASP